MLDVCLLGTGGMMPLPNRWLTALMVRFEGSQLLIDCGEGTQIAARQKGWSFKPIDSLLITHFHADHISGLPGLLLTMGNAERTEPLHIYGPKGLVKVVSALRIIAPELPFDIILHELKENNEYFKAGPFMVHAFKVYHAITCYGYSLHIPRAGKFDANAAQKLGLPVRFWNPLQKGNVVEYGGKTFTPDMVMGPKRRGLKVTYCTDSRPVPQIAEAAADSDLFVCEGIYGDSQRDSKAEEYKHMTFLQAARLAREADVRRLWLTHYSPALSRPDEYLAGAREIFPGTKVCRDGRSIVLKFDEE